MAAPYDIMNLTSYSLASPLNGYGDVELSIVKSLNSQILN